ncbi:hypothetical protein HanRHA438_Chr02g0091441 [Helianthus annuus]|nr:hypothetical protein HanRHA438_Chr02g0091441 [Helianthus annuus]
MLYEERYVNQVHPSYKQWASRPGLCLFYFSLVNYGSNNSLFIFIIWAVGHMYGSNRSIMSSLVGSG